VQPARDGSAPAPILTLRYATLRTTTTKKFGHYVLDTSTHYRISITIPYTLPCYSSCCLSFHALRRVFPRGVFFHPSYVHKRVCGSTMISVDSPSIAATSSSPPQTCSSSPANLHYAFLVHSQKTLTQNLPPRVDNKLLARQKRRRTR
jgi:hypothetical protein